MSSTRSIKKNKTSGDYGFERTSSLNVLKSRGLTKSFSNSTNRLDILKGINIDIRRGEIVTIQGASGAGKSTLVKYIYGVQKADSGTLEWCGKQTKINNPKMARKLGIGMVFQHFSLFDALTVKENISLGILMNKIMCYLTSSNIK